MNIEHIHYSLGQDRRSIADWCERTEAPTALRERMQSAGLRHYHDHGDGDVGEMVCAAIDALLAQHSVAADDIDLAVYFHTQQTSVPGGGQDIGTLLSRRFGMRCPAFALSQQNCVSSLVALQFIDSLFQSQPRLQRVLLVGADSIGIDSLRSVNGGVGFHSDGAVAATLVRGGRAGDGRNEWKASEFLSFAEHYRGMQSPPELAMALDRHYYLATHKVITGALRKSGMRAGELRWLLPHNVNTPGWKAIASGLQLDLGSVFTQNIADKSHIYGCDGLINLADIQSAQQLQEGEPYLIFSMGYGGFFGAAVLQH